MKHENRSSTLSQADDEAFSKADSPDNQSSNPVLAGQTATLGSLPPPEPTTERSSKQTQDGDNLENTPPYTDGPCRIVLTTDGTKECLALLLTEDVVAGINEITTLNRQVKVLQCKFGDAADDANIAQIFPDQSLALIATTEDSDEQTRIRGEMPRMERTKKEASKRRDRIEKYLIIYKGNLAFSREESQELLERVLGKAGLLNSESEDQIAVEGLDASEAPPSEQRSDITHNTDDTFISVERLSRLATYQGLLETERWHQTLQDRFDIRRETCDQKFLEYCQAVEDGTCSLSKSEFDRIDLSNLRNLTTAIIEAEASHEYAKVQARALGIIGNDMGQESDFVSQESDGYRESLDAEICAGVNRDYIEAWSTEVGDRRQDHQDPEGQRSDEWDAETVEISDSISLVDQGRNRRKIDRWRKICGL